MEFKSSIDGPPLIKVKNLYKFVSSYESNKKEGVILKEQQSSVKTLCLNFYYLSILNE